MSLKKKYLVLGPLEKGGIVGGLTVSFRIFLDQLKKKKIDFEVINTNMVNDKCKALTLIYIYWVFLKKVRNSSHISLHGSNNDLIYLAPFVVFFTKILSKTVSFRKFAGDFTGEEFENLSFLKKSLVKYALSNSNINFFQTRYLVKYFKQYNDNTFWFPTVRNKPKISTNKSKRYQKRFIYLGHIYWEKGIDLILEVSKLIDDSYHIDLYGPITEPKYENFFWEKYTNITYNGSLRPDDVAKVLSTYDVLILPSYREGYPGVIIEAFSLGIPVIATKLEGIKEMVNLDAGILIDINNIEQLQKAIQFFNENNYIDYSKSALENYSQFNAEIKVNEIVEQINKTTLYNK